MEKIFVRLIVILVLILLYFLVIYVISPEFQFNHIIGLAWVFFVVYAYIDDLVLTSKQSSFLKSENPEKRIESDRKAKKIGKYGRVLLLFSFLLITIIFNAPPQFILTALMLLLAFGTLLLKPDLLIRKPKKIK